MKIYVDGREKYKDVKSTAYSFGLVGIIVLVLVALVWVNVIPLPLDSVNKIMMSIVMGIMALIFIGVSLKSFASLKRLESDTNQQESQIQEIIKWFKDEYSDQMLVQFDSSAKDFDEEVYFQRYNFIFDNVKANYQDLSEEVVDHISEVIYSEIYNEKQ